MYASRNPVSTEINTVKSDIKDILQSGKYYCTEEIARELTKINNGLDHINLDHNLLSTSRTWKNNFDPRETTLHHHNVVSSMDKASATLFDIKNQLNVEKLKDNEENELREKHQWAIDNLQTVQQSLDPHTHVAAERINKFSDHIGVTDKFTRFRNNRNKIPDPVRTQTQQIMRLERARTSIGTPAADLRSRRYGERMQSENYGVMGGRVQYSDYRPPEHIYKGYRTIDSLYPRATIRMKPDSSTGLNYNQTLNDIKTMNSMNAMDETKRQTFSTENQLMTQAPSKSAAEMAGINVVFPGTTLYNDEYVPPNLNLPTSHFIINPSPDFLVNGRPLAKAPIIPPTSSEYQSRYEWPEGRKMRRLPWLNVH